MTGMDSGIVRIVAVMVTIGKPVDATDIFNRGISLRYPVYRIQKYLDLMRKRGLVYFDTTTKKYTLIQEMVTQLRLKGNNREYFE